MLHSSNPYQPPVCSRDAVPTRLPREWNAPQRGFAMMAFGLTISTSSGFIYYAESAASMRLPPGMVLIVATSIVSILTAITTRDIFFSPLCCFGGMMSGVLLAALMNDWEYVSLPVTIPISLVASIPAFVIAMIRSKDRRLSQPVVHL